MNNTDINTLAQRMHEHADDILEMERDCEEDGYHRKELIEAYDKADSLFGAKNILIILDALEAAQQEIIKPLSIGELLQRLSDQTGENWGDKYTAELEASQPVVPEGWKLVPIEPTEDMIVDGFESKPDEFFSDAEEWDKYIAMSGCARAAHRAKLCWAAMLAAAPALQEGE